MTDSSAFANAVIAQMYGLKVYPAGKIWAPNADSLASSDLALLEKIHAIDPQANWLVRCGAEFGLLALDTPRQRDFDALVRDMGKFPSTLTIGRPSGGVVRWFKCPPDADIRLNVSIAGTRAIFRRSAVIPGTIHLASGERYDVVNGGAFDLDRLASLPDAWLRASPKNTQGITANLVLRHEFKAQVSDY